MAVYTWGGTRPTSNTDGYEGLMGTWLDDIQSNATSLDEEVETARGGETDLSTRINAVAATVGSLYSSVSNASRTSDTTITIAGSDETDDYPEGTPIRGTKSDSSTEDYYVVSAAYGGTDTVITVDRTIDSTVTTGFSRSNVLLGHIPKSSGAIREEILDDNANEMLVFTSTASAVNHFSFTNNSTGQSPTIASAGDDTNIDLQINAKGTGVVRLASTGSYFNSDGDLVVSGDMQVDTNLLYVDSTNDRVGIGMSSNLTVDLQLATNGILGLGNSSATRPDFQLSTDASTLDLACGTGADTADLQIDTNGNLGLVSGNLSFGIAVGSAKHSVHMADTESIGFGTGDTNRADFQIVSASGASLGFVCGTGADTVDIFMSSNGGLNVGSSLTDQGAGSLNISDEFYISGTSVLSSSTLGSGITSSSLTSVGALDSGSITSNFGSINVGSSQIRSGQLRIDTVGRVLSDWAVVTAGSTLTMNLTNQYSIDSGCTGYFYVHAQNSTTLTKHSHRVYFMANRAGDEVLTQKDSHTASAGGVSFSFAHDSGTGNYAYTFTNNESSDSIRVGIMYVGTGEDI